MEERSKPDAAVTRTDVSPAQSGGMVPTVSAVGPSATTNAAGGGAADLPEVPRYRLIGLLGRGGMGEVYEAEQNHPRRRVALKVIRPGLTSHAHLRRFEYEADVLGRMRHPSIAQIYESGTFDAGRGPQPFFAMELVTGPGGGRAPTIAEYVQSQNTGVVGRLELLARVCDAVQHAHQHGVIHRDLKPANILIDEHGQPKVLDFGVARLTDSDVQATTLQTDVGQIVGTLPYMSPEQAGGNPAEIDTRSDVYALGVIAYELLSGRLPHDLKRAALHEAVRLIREEEPTRLSTLSRGLRGDVETIVNKAMAKEKQRRYASAAELASDVRRYLADEPIAARPPSVRYHVAKFARRNRILVSGAAAVFVVLVAGIIATRRQAVRAERALAAETVQRGLAQDATAHEAAQRKQAEAVAGLLESVFVGLDPFAEKKGGADLKTQLAAELDRAAAGLDREYAGEAAIRIRLRRTLAATQLGLGEARKAESLLEAVLKDVAAQSPPDEFMTLDTLSRLGLAYTRSGRVAEAITVLEDVRDRQTRMLGADHPGTLETRGFLVGAYYEARRPRDAIATAEQLLEPLSRRYGPGDQRTLTTTDDLAIAYLDVGRVPDAIRLLEQVRDGMSSLLGADHPDVLATLHNLASAYVSARRYPDAIKLLEQVRERQVAKLGAAHVETLRTVGKLAEAKQFDGQTAEAIALFEEVFARQIEKIGVAHTDTILTEGKLLNLYHAPGRTEDLIRHLRQWLDAELAQLGPQSPQSVGTVWYLGDLYYVLGRDADAEALLRQAAEWYLAHPEAAAKQRMDPTARLLPSVVDCYRTLNRPEPARQWEQALRAALEKKLDDVSRDLAGAGSDPTKTARLLDARISLYRRLGRFPEAAAELARRVEGDPNNLVARYVLACLRAYLDDGQGYRATCGELLARFGMTTDRAAGEKTVKACLLKEGGVTDVAPLARLADQAVAPSPTPQPLIRYFTFAKGLAEYRRGNLEGAIDWMGKSRSLFTTRIAGLGRVERNQFNDGLCLTTAGFVLAIAELRLGHREQAEQALAQARTEMKRYVPEVDSGDVRVGFEDWMVVHVVARDAEAMFRDQTATTQAAPSTRAATAQ